MSITIKLSTLVFVAGVYAVSRAMNHIYFSPVDTKTKVKGVAEKFIQTLQEMAHEQSHGKKCFVSFLTDNSWVACLGLGIFADTYNRLSLMSQFANGFSKPGIFDLIVTVAVICLVIQVAREILSYISTRYFGQIAPSYSFFYSRQT